MQQRDSINQLLEVSQHHSEFVWINSSNVVVNSTINRSWNEYACDSMRNQWRKNEILLFNNVGEGEQGEEEEEEEEEKKKKRREDGNSITWWGDVRFEDINDN